MEIGSYLELDLKSTGEYFTGNKDIARLNTGRSGIYHALKILGCKIIYLPYYLCPDVKLFLEKKSIDIRFYNITEEFEPILDENPPDSAMLLVNHFGIMNHDRLDRIKRRYRNVIIDNCASFFMIDIPDCFNVYSCRKFFGVPDGCYVLGPGAHLFEDEYSQDKSSATSHFLLKRIELGCSAAYSDRNLNEDRLNHSDILSMSILTKSLLNSLDYDFILHKRKTNFEYANSLFQSVNLLKFEFSDQFIAPIFFPLVVKDEFMVEKMKSRGIYTGRRWNSVLDNVPKGSFEAFLSRYMVPLPIDQRYGKEVIDYYRKVFDEIISS